MFLCWKCKDYITKVGILKRKMGILWAKKSGLHKNLYSKVFFWKDYAKEGNSQRKKVGILCVGEEEIQKQKKEKKKKEILRRKIIILWKCFFVKNVKVTIKSWNSVGKNGNSVSKKIRTPQKPLFQRFWKGLCKKKGNS